MDARFGMLQVVTSHGSLLCVRVTVIVNWKDLGSMLLALSAMLPSVHQFCLRATLGRAASTSIGTTAILEVSHSSLRGCALSAEAIPRVDALPDGLDQKCRTHACRQTHLRDVCQPLQDPMYEHQTQPEVHGFCYTFSSTLTHEMLGAPRNVGARNTHPRQADIVHANLPAS